MKNYADPAEIMYHTGLSAGMIRGAKYALLPGDPGAWKALPKHWIEMPSSSPRTGITPHGSPG